MNLWKNVAVYESNISQIEIAKPCICQNFQNIVLRTQTWIKFSPRCKRSYGFELKDIGGITTAPEMHFA